jgi:hypothetical protein
MPGYGLFCAAAGALFGHRTIEIVMSTILLQIIFYRAALGILRGRRPGVSSLCRVGGRCDRPAACSWLDEGR